jgi:AcrR family transcriptional regulator
VHEDLGLRERKKAETRQAIADAALALAVERGPGDVTVDDIAAAAGVSARTVFNYFPTKEAAILGVDPQRRRDLLDRLAARPAGEPPLQAMREALRSDDPASAVAWRTRGRLARDHPQLQSAYLAGFATLEDELTAVIAARLPAGPTNAAYARLVVIVALSAMRVAVDAAIDAGADVTNAVDLAFEAVAGGLQPPGS